MEDAASKGAHPSNSHQLDVITGVADVHDVHVADRNDRKQVLSGMWVCCMPCYWLRTNTSLHKASLTVVTLLVTSLLVASPVLFLISSVPASEQPLKDCNVVMDEDCLIESTVPDVPLSKCDTPACKDIARRMRYSLSWDYDPCKNFYNFACGGWSESKKADSSHPYSLGVDLSVSTLHKKIILLIQMYRVLDQLGGYLPPGSLGPNDLTPLITSILKVSGTPLFDLAVAPHIKNKSIPSLYVDLPDGIVDNMWQNYQPEFVPQNILHKYSKYFVNHHTDWQRTKRETKNMKNPYNYLKVKNLEVKLLDLEMIVSGMLPKRMDPTEKAAEIQQILLFSSTVEQLLPGQKQLRSELSELTDTSSYTEQKLQDEFPIVNWHNLLKQMVPKYEKLGMNIYVISVSYMKSLSDIIKKFQNRIIHNALLAMYARDLLHHVVDMKSVKPQDLYCTMITIHTFPYPVSALYLSHYTQEYLGDLQKRADDMFMNLKLSLFNRVEKAHWIDNESRWKAMDCIDNLTARFVAWPPLLNATVVDQIIGSMMITNDFFDNIMNHYRQKRAMQMQIDGTVPFDLQWPYPFVVNAFYDPLDNCVVLPLAFLTQPYFSIGVPAYISYGSIGVILAHEMMHSLDYNGFHGKTISSLWKNSKSLGALQSRLACVANSYHKSSKKGFKFLGKNIQVELDGNFTLDETTADLSGTQVAWGAWRQLENADKEKTLSQLPLTPSKLFFLSLSQLYCMQISTEDYIMAIEENFHMTPLERVNGLVRNTFAFAESYHCTVGSPMNPAVKCNIW